MPLSPPPKHPSLRAEAHPPGQCGATIHTPARGHWLQRPATARCEWTHVQLPIPGLPAALDGIRIAHLSDFHLTPRWLGIYDEILGHLQQHRPDLILFTGDFIDDRRDHRPALPILRRLFGSLLELAPIHSVLGNHDLDLPPSALDELGIQRLDLARRRIRVPARDAEIELIGLAGRNRADLTAGFVESIPPRNREGEERTPRIILSHYPDLIRQTHPLEPDLFLAGHTHGGQICLPGGVPILRHAALPRRLCRGVHRLGETWLITSRGVGFTHLPLRLFCPPQALLLELSAAALPLAAAGSSG